MIRFKSLILGAALAGALCGAAFAAPNPPQNGYPVNSDIGAVLTNTLRTPATVTGTPSVPNNNWRGVVCTSLWTASSGSPTEVFSIEGFDAATAAWYQIATTGTKSSNAGGTPTTLAVYPGVAVGSLSTGNSAQSAVLPKVWRAKSVVGSGGGAAGPALSNKIGCNYID